MLPTVLQEHPNERFKARRSRALPRNDRLLASLNAHVRRQGGILKIVAELPGVEPVELEITQRATVKSATAALLRETDIRPVRRWPARPEPRQRRSA
jgi:hypothetical protein